MGEYNSIKEKIINQEPVNPSYGALKAAFDLFKLDLAKDFLKSPGVTDEVLNNLDQLSSEEHFLVFLMNEIPNSELYLEIKKNYLHLEMVWQKVVEIEKIPLNISGTYITGDNQAVVKSDKLTFVDILLENKDHSIISSLNKLNEKQSFDFTAQLQVGSLYTYQGLINLGDLEEKVKAIQNQEQKESAKFAQYRSKASKAMSGLALTVVMAVSLVGCGQNPGNDLGGGYNEPPPSNNSPDCIIRKAEFYDRLSQLRIGMNEEEVDEILDPQRRMRKGNFKYSTSYEIEGYDYSVPGVVTCEAVQLHYDSYWRFRQYTLKTYPL